MTLPHFGLDTISVSTLGYVAHQFRRQKILKHLEPCSSRIPQVWPLLLILLATAVTPPASAAPKKIIFDTDPGSDDAMALMLALHSPELDVRAITVVPGNVTASQGLENALRMVSLANRCDIPVAAGAQHPLFQKLITAEFWHGKNGLADVELPPSKCKVDARFGPDLIIQMVHGLPHEITLVPVGPLTNIALAVLKDPSIVPLVKEVVFMGGSISGGNVNAAAEANIHNDPEAAQIVFQAGWPPDHGRTGRWRQNPSFPEGPRPARQHAWAGQRLHLCSCQVSDRSFGAIRLAGYADVRSASRGSGDRSNAGESSGNARGRRNQRRIHSRPNRRKPSRSD